MLKTMQNIGRVTRKPELRYTADGKPVCKFTIAVNDGSEKVEFVDVVTWNRLAENCSQYLDKGRLVYVNGHWELRSYTDKQGEKRLSIEMNDKKYGINIVFLPTGGNAQAATTGEKVNSPGAPALNNEFVPELDDDVPL